MADPWVYWALFGIVCIGLEMLIPGFVIFFFGLGSLMTALTSLIPFIQPYFWLQIILFIAFSLVSLVLLRKYMAKFFEGTVFNPVQPINENDEVGQIGEVIEAVAQTVPGRIKFKGTTWNAVSVSDPIALGESVKIISRSGMTYTVSKI